LRTEKGDWRFAVLCFLITAAFRTACPQNTTDMPAWQKAAGGSMQFDVASIREDDGPFEPPSFALSADDWFREPNGRFHADFPVEAYISFAYKLWVTGEQRDLMLAHAPAWVKTVRYKIEATAPLHATKDQYRLMMQSLMAERLGLKVHYENREMPVLEMTLLKPGQPGPKLIPHVRGLDCDAKPTADTFPEFCYGYVATPKDAGALLGSRATSLKQIGDFLGSIGESTGETGRPVVDRTGLTGLWDFTVWAQGPWQKADSDATQQVPTMLEAIRDQLGLRLKPAKDTIPVLIVDHVDRPSEN
jgi:uncharacterized protein (TIGR03435 family)